MKSHQASLGKTDVWLTPRYILDALGKFDLDPCAADPCFRPWPTASMHYSESDDGLSKGWGWNRVWLNPPFNRYQRPLWMERMADHRMGVMLIPAATETKAFADYVWTAAMSVLFFDHRPHFCDAHGQPSKADCGCSLCLVAYSPADSQCLKCSGLGHFVWL